MRAPTVARAAATVALLLALLARPATAQSEAVQVPCNVQSTNVTVASLGPAGSNKTGLLCGYSIGSSSLVYSQQTQIMFCYDSVQVVLAVVVGNSYNAQLPAHGIVFHDYLICSPPLPFTDPNTGAKSCYAKGPFGQPINPAFIVYIGTQC